jgi:plasmid stability protein
MAQLHVRNVPDDLVAALKERAGRNRRSMEAEHRHILEEVLRPACPKERMLEALQGLAWDDPGFQPKRSRDSGGA